MFCIVETIANGGGAFLESADVIFLEMSDNIYGIKMCIGQQKYRAKVKNSG